jgi:hypothetical protein
LHHVFPNCDFIGSPNQGQYRCRDGSTQLLLGGRSLAPGPSTLRESAPRLHPPVHSLPTGKRAASDLKSLPQC